MAYVGRRSSAVDPLSQAINAGHVALFGASASAGKWGNTVATRLVSGSYRGRLTLVNPKGGEVLGHPVVRAEEARGADLAVIATPAAVVPGVIRECGTLGIPIAIVQAGGFGEAGNVTLQAELDSAAIESDVRIIGPNCVGIFVGSSGLNTTPMPELPTGAVSLISQSGALGDHIARRLADYDAGFDVWFSLGNKMDVGFVDALEVLIDRPTTSSVVFYLEGLDEGEPFLDLIGEVSEKIPIVAILAGQTSAGKRATHSHTGSMISSWYRGSSLLKSVGVQVVSDPSAAIAAAVAGQRDGKREIENVYVLGDGGGEVVLLADALEAGGYVLRLPSANLASRLGELVTLSDSTRNPMDLQGRADANPQGFLRLLEVIMESSEYDAVVLSGLFGAYAKFWGPEMEHEEISAIRGMSQWTHAGGVVLVQSPYAKEPSESLRVMRQAGIPCLEWPSEIVHALNVRNSRQVRRNSHQMATPMNAYTPDPRLGAVVDRVVQALDNANIPHGLGRPVERQELPVTSEQPWVLRLDTFPHKAAAGAIHVWIKGDELEKSFDELLSVAQEAGVKPVVRLGPLIPHFRELIVSFWRDPLEGNGCLIGQGGAGVEKRADIAVARFPRSAEDVRSILGRSSAGMDILNNEIQSVEAVVDLVLKLCDVFASDLDDLTELECNPIGIDESDAYVLDVLPSWTSD